MFQSDLLYMQRPRLIGQTGGSTNDLKKLLSNYTQLFLKYLIAKSFSACFSISLSMFFLLRVRSGGFADEEMLASAKALLLENRRGRCVNFYVLSH